ncbi:MAG: hypothetical protein GY794_19145 [bacterium]|nr:hypothetical protein [bacterium]
MRTKRAITALFIVSAIYDGLLGIAFLFASAPLFKWFGVTPPNHPGYVQFPAALLIVFAVMFMAIAAQPVKNRNLIPYGILFKVSYCGVVMFHWFTAGLPSMWKPFCIADLIFLGLYAYAWTVLGKEHPRTNETIIG